MRRIGGYLINLKCDNCESGFTVLVLSADTDMETYGLVSLTAYNENAVAIGELNQHELQSTDAWPDAFVERINNDQPIRFYYPELLRYENNQASVASEDFATFRKNYVPPTPVFRCRRCGGQAYQVSRLSLSKYLSEGGKVVMIDNVTLFDCDNS